MPNHISHPANKVSMYFFAGVATSTDFMDDFRMEMMANFTEMGLMVEADLWFPYGDWSRRLVRQLNEIRQDITLGWGFKGESIRGRKAAEQILASYTGETIILIGHSGGGMVAIHAAQILLRENGIAVSRIIQIGSPKCPVSNDIQARVLYIYGVNHKGKSVDPVTKLGTWGGWEKGEFRLPRWNPHLSAPKSIRNVSIIGGHADYFRRRNPYVNSQGSSNLQLTMAAIWEWMDISEM